MIEREIFFGLRSSPEDCRSTRTQTNTNPDGAEAIAGCWCCEFSQMMWVRLLRAYWQSGLAPRSFFLPLNYFFLSFFRTCSNFSLVYISSQFSGFDERQPSLTGARAGTKSTSPWFPPSPLLAAQLPSLRSTAELKRLSAQSCVPFQRGALNCATHVVAEQQRPAVEEETHSGL